MYGVMRSGGPILIKAGVVVWPLLVHFGHGHGHGCVLAAWLCGGGLVCNGLPHDRLVARRVDRVASVGSP